METLRKHPTRRVAPVKSQITRSRRPPSQQFNAGKETYAGRPNCKIAIVSLSSPIQHQKHRMPRVGRSSDSRASAKPTFSPSGNGRKKEWFAVVLAYSGGAVPDSHRVPCSSAAKPGRRPPTHVSTARHHNACATRCKECRKKISREGAKAPRKTTSNHKEHEEHQALTHEIVM